MTAPLDDLYLEWLYRHFGSVRNRAPARTFWTLARHLYSREFVWLIANDDNRAQDGKELRDEFASEQGLDELDPNWAQLGCSMLEMLVALSRRAAFESNREASDWFWIFLRNMGLHKITDAVASANDVEGIIDEAVERVVFRTYYPNGVGGLFPLHDPHSDQRRVELWYQLSAYLLEGSYI